MKKSLTTLYMILVISIYSIGQTWTQLAYYPGSGRVCMSGIGYSGNGYAGFGYYGSSSNCFLDWWQYTPNINTWVSKTGPMANQRYNQSVFATDSNIYICLGSDGTYYFNDVWQYSKTYDNWVQKATFPGVARYGAIAQASGTKAYIGLGKSDDGYNNTYYSNFYEYDATANTWYSKQTLPAQGREGAVSFLINNVIYVVGGRGVDNQSNWIYLNETWAFDIANNSWSLKAAYPGNGSTGMAGFALGQYGYVGMGYSNLSGYCGDFWRYDPQWDAWTQLPDFPGTVRDAMFHYNIGNTGYMGCGYSAGTFLYDFWKFTDPSAGIDNITAKKNINLYPDPADNKLTIEMPSFNVDRKEVISISDVQGQPLIQQPMLQAKEEINISSLVTGVYFIKVSNADGVAVKKFIKE